MQYNGNRQRNNNNNNNNNNSNKTESFDAYVGAHAHDVLDIQFGFQSDVRLVVGAKDGGNVPNCRRIESVECEEEG
jgi:hypothetical protein